MSRLEARPYVVPERCSERSEYVLNVPCVPNVSHNMLFRACSPSRSRALLRAKVSFRTDFRTYCSEQGQMTCHRAQGMPQDIGHGRDMGHAHGSYVMPHGPGPGPMVSAHSVWPMGMSHGPPVSYVLRHVLCPVACPMSCSMSLALVRDNMFRTTCSEQCCSERSVGCNHGFAASSK